MDYVAPGKVIKLSPKDSIVLGYMTSCWRETITGGTVLVGAEQSMVHEGEIERVKVDCDGGGQYAAADRTPSSSSYRSSNSGPRAGPLGRPLSRRPGIG